MPGLLDLPLELRRTILQHATQLEEIDLCADHTFIDGVKCEPSIPALGQNPHLPLHLICQTVFRDLQTFTLPRLDLEFCSFICAYRRLRCVPKQAMACVQIIQFSTSILDSAERTTSQKSWEHYSEDALSAKVVIEALGLHSRGLEEGVLIRMVARVVWPERMLY